MNHPIGRIQPFIKGACVLLMAASLTSGQNKIDMASSHQTISGFGGINFPRWIADLSVEQTDRAFGNGPGKIGLSILRISTAPNKADWSKELPVAKRAIGYGAKVFSSPWSPPTSMKTNGSLVDGSIKESSFADWAKYLTDFVEYMKTNGVPLHAISIQNEPDITVSYESARWSATQIQTFLKNHAAGIPTKVMAAESFNANKAMMDPSLNDPQAAANFDIVAVHLYGTKVSGYPYPLAKSKGKELWMTEHYTTSDRSANLWPDALGVGKEIHNCMVSDYNAYVWWYIRRSYGLLTEDGAVSKRGYTMSHYSRFVRPGYVRVDVPATPEANVQVTAYRNGGSLVVVLVNGNNDAKTQSFTIANASSPLQSLRKYTTSASKNVQDDGSVSVTNSAFSVTLDAQSITTLVHTGTTGAEDDLRPRSGSVSTQEESSYEVFDLSGRRIGMVQATPGRSLQSEIERVAPRAGLFLLKSEQGARTLQINVRPTGRSR